MIVLSSPLDPNCGICLIVLFSLVNIQLDLMLRYINLSLLPVCVYNCILKSLDMQILFIYNLIKSLWFFNHSVPLIAKTTRL